MMYVHGILAVMLEIHFMEFVLNLWCNKYPIPLSLAQQLFTPEMAFLGTIYWDLEKEDLVSSLTL